jgi:hypothetical protein
MDAVDAVADLANRSSDYMTDPAVNVHPRSRHGYNWDEPAATGIDGDVRTSAIACAATRANKRPMKTSALSRAPSEPGIDLFVTTVTAGRGQSPAYHHQLSCRM